MSKFKKGDRARFNDRRDFVIYTVDTFDGDVVELVEKDGLYHKSKFVKVEPTITSRMWGMIGKLLS